MAKKKIKKIQVVRLVEFRAWDKRNSRFITWEDDRFTVADFVAKCPKYIVLNQFIGLCDKDDKKIYEGDILDWDGEKVVIKYGLQCVDAFVGYGWNLWSFYNHEGEGYEPNDKRLVREIKVIGNIYQNPELLKH